MDILSQLTPDLLISKISYLPFDDVIKICSQNSKLKGYCMNPNYSNKWKTLIDNTFSHVYNYEEKLRKIQEEVKIITKTNQEPEKIYNYLVYTQLIKLLDPVTQSMIYYKQGDMKSFKQFPQEIKFLALFLLGKRNIIEKYLPLEKRDFKYFIDLMDYELKDISEEGEDYIPISPRTLTMMAFLLAVHGSVNGIIKLEKIVGEELWGREQDDMVTFSLVRAAENRHLDVVRYLAEKGGNIHASSDSALMFGAHRGDLDMVKYLTRIGKYDIEVLKKAYNIAIEKKHLNVVKYLENIIQSHNIEMKKNQLATKYLTKYL